MKEGKKEKDVMRVVWCRGFKKLLDIKDCNSEKCEYHAGIRKEPIHHREAGGELEIVGYNEWVLCTIPRQEQIITVCEA